MPNPGSPVRSMTGFATATTQAPNGPAFSLTIKSVNHRFLDLRLHLPSGSDALEQRLRPAIRERVHRGHVELTLTPASAQDGRPATTLRLNDDLLSAYLRAFAQAAQTHGFTSSPDLNELLRLPGVMTTEAPAVTPDRADLEAAVFALLPNLLDRFDTARAQEGAALEVALRASIAHIQRCTAEIADLRQRVKPAHLDRLRTRMAELLVGASVSEERLLAEAALLTERSDIDEETVRLHAHADRFLALLDTGGEVGKRLDFLLQEFGREANTILSKTGSASGPDSLRLTELGLEIKAEIERVREQVQNLE